MVARFKPHISEAAMGLRVIEQFGDYKVGDLIADGVEADQVLKSERASYVVRVADVAAEKSIDMPKVFVTDDKK
jgi:hypothetical protein